MPVEFCLTKAGRPIAAASAFALLSGLVAAPVLRAQDAAAQQQPAGQPAAGQPAAGQKATKNWKDRAEYDLYTKAAKGADPQAKLAALKEWQEKYPQSEFSDMRNQLWLGTLAQQAPKDPAAKPELLTKAGEVLKQDPKNFQAAYLISVYGPQVGGQNPQPDLLTQVDTAAQTVMSEAPNVFDQSKKPANMSAEQFDNAKKQSLVIAHNAMIWEARSKKDNAALEAAYKDGLKALPDQSKWSAEYAQMLVGQKKMPEGLFEYARAAQYEGPGALPPATRQQLMDYFNKVYKNFHGSDDGKQQLLDQAKGQALPPEGMEITDASALAAKHADELNARIQAEPGFKVWYSIKQQLQDRGDGFFNGDLKGFEVPGDSVPSKSFTGTVVSADPSRVTLGVEDPAKPDATLEFSKPLPSAAMDKVKVGEKLDFSGIVDSYVKEPYMLTIKDPTIPGVQTSSKKGTSRRR